MVSLPHPDKAKTGGEDAYIVSDEYSAASLIAHGNSMIAVLDGVGSWGNHGVDPGLFSRDLARR